MIGRKLALSLPPIRRLYDSRVELQATIREQRRALKRQQTLLDDPAVLRFFAYKSTFHAVELMRRHEVHSEPTPGFQTNWLGVLIDPKIFPYLKKKAGTVEEFPYPANWHADIAEWAAVLRAVENAPGDSFSVIELGCGWGCWMNNSGVPARRTGRKVHLIGIEGDEGHLEFAREALDRNGFAAEEYTLLRGIAAAADGTALFPRQEHAGRHWGLEPVFAATAAQVDEAVRSGSHDALPMIPLAEAIGPRSRIDLLHIDIQGGEADIIESCLDVINEKIAYLMIGTHGRGIEERLFDTLTQAGWHLEVERPSFFGIRGAKPVLEVDGVQGWRNPALMIG
jgi:hypothetical protein